jgi:alpha-1,3-glucosyltransferase
MAANSKANLRILVILSAAGIFSLYPLLFQPTGKKKKKKEKRRQW